MFSMPERGSDREPTAADLAAIEEEWPQIEADMSVLDAEIRRLVSADVADELVVRRVRRARRRLLRVPGGPGVPGFVVVRVPLGGGEAA